MSDNTLNSNNDTELAWDKIKNVYPIILDSASIEKDDGRAAILAFIDGTSTVTNISEFIGLEPAESELLFSDLFNSGIIKFLSKEERLPFLRKNNVKLKQDMDFHISELAKAKGKIYYYKTKLSQVKKESIELKQNTESINKQLETVPEKEHILNKIDEAVVSKSELICKIGQLEKDYEDIEDDIQIYKRKLNKLKRKREKTFIKTNKIFADITDKNQKGKELKSVFSTYVNMLDDMKDELDNTYDNIADLLKNHEFAIKE